MIANRVCDGACVISHLQSSRTTPFFVAHLTMGPTWHNGRAMTSAEYQAVKQVWLGNAPKLRSFKEAALLKRCWFARDMNVSMIWRRADVVDPHTGILLFGQEVDLDPDSDSD